MKCQSCGENEASVHFTKIINGKLKEKHLCEDCAGYEKEISFIMPFSFNELFSGLIDIDSPSDRENRDKVCPKCGITYNRLTSVGKFGCSKCFDTFSEEISAVLRNIQGHDEHVGKIPSKSSVRIQLRREKDSLKNQLRKAVDMEEYEKAAELRDRIRLLEKEIELEKNKPTTLMKREDSSLMKLEEEGAEENKDDTREEE